MVDFVGHVALGVDSNEDVLAGYGGSDTQKLPDSFIVPLGPAFCEKFAAVIQEAPPAGEGRYPGSALRPDMQQFLRAAVSAAVEEGVLQPPPTYSDSDA
jgi:hypothetical protein